MPRAGQFWFVCLILPTLGLAACDPGSTQLEVLVEADPEVAARSSRVLFEVRTQEGQLAHSEQFDPLETPFPIRRRITPRNNDATRVVTITVRAIDSDGNALTTARVIRPFVPAATIEVRLRLYDLCLGTNCPEPLTCEPRAGRAECVNAQVTSPLDASTDSQTDAESARCPAGQSLCGADCVNTDSDELNCGLCERTCAADQVCTRGICQITGCVGPVDCPLGTYCAMELGQCLSGCDEGLDCGSDASCDQETHECKCAEGSHLCSGACVPDNAVSSCGEHCGPCDVAENSTATCEPAGDGFVCGNRCNAGFNFCGGVCVLASSPLSCGPSCEICPNSTRGSAICTSGQCGLACGEGATLCPTPSGSDCVDTASDLLHCGTCGRACESGRVCQEGRCIEPPDCDVNNPASCVGLTYCNPVNSRCAPGCDSRLPNQCGRNEQCANNQCVCGAGYHDCDGVCLNDNSVNSCGALCAPCPAPTNALQMGCADGGCVVWVCNAGYQVSADGRSCVDVNECATNRGGCHSNATCENTEGGRTCTCNSGYTGSGINCSDINECQTGNGGCDVNARCTNLSGGLRCTCNAGFIGDGLSCTDVNECLTNNGGCDARARCTNTSGSRSCTCMSGYSGDGLTCELACSSGTQNCGGRCVSPTSFDHCGPSCRPCGTLENASFVGCDGVDCVVLECSPGWRISPNAQSCEDVNECLTGNGGCDPNARCTNTQGSRLCVCPSGYTGNGLVCSDINECTSGNGGCDVNASCTNTPGSRTCTCRSGYTGSGTVCSDINECTTGNGGCDTNARCTNTAGARTCTCNAGYTGDGLRCALDCGADQHVCSNMCVANNSPATCGTSCTPCPAHDNATPTCDGTRCGYVCNPGFAQDASGDCVRLMWRLRTPTNSPSARNSHRMVYDAARRQVVLFGGTNSGLVGVNTDTWTWDGSNWTRRSPATSPPPRVEFSMGYDRERREVVLFGGYYENNRGERVFLDDTWIWDGTNWTQRSPTTRPSADFSEMMYFDQDRRRLVLFRRNESSWTWTGTNWTEVSDIPRHPASPFHFFYDEGRRRLTSISSGGFPPLSTWSLGPQGWTRFAGTANPSQAHIAGAYDSVRGVYVTHSLFESRRPELWTWDGAVWSQLTSTAYPEASYGHQVVYDEARQEVVLFGGQRTANPRDLGQTWVFGIN